MALMPLQLSVRVLPTTFFFGPSFLNVQPEFASV